ncbi:MAG TPA: hypothetical protein VNS32_20065 [Flavisolibacter sp.]|nr:hypothetical protein [Flavisolibacter sp.]
MLKTILQLLIFCCPLWLKAQVTINVQLPPSGLVQRDQLWNLILVNNGNEILDVTLSMFLQQTGDGQTVLSATTGRLQLPKGVKVISARDLQPVQYNYGNGSSSTEYLPVGSFTACYRVSKIGSEAIPVIADNCVGITIQPLSPPLLNQPLDTSKISSPYPLLSWIPPTPAEMYSDLNYELTVVEIKDGQNPVEAISHNTAFYMTSYLKVLYQNYPSFAPELQAGKHYAWQIKAYNGNRYSAASEVWSFYLTDSTKEKLTTENVSYILLENNNESSGIHVLNHPSLYLKYYCYDKAYDAQIQFLDAKGKIVDQKKQYISYGDNFLHFELSRSFKKNEVYTVRLINIHQQYTQAQFSIQ